MPGAAQANYDLAPALEPVAHAIPGAFRLADTDGLGIPGEGEIRCWDRDAWKATGMHPRNGWAGWHEISLGPGVCQPLLKSVEGWRPHRHLRQWYVAWGTFLLLHEAAHTSGADHDEIDGPSADCLAARFYRRGLARLGIGPTRARVRLQRIVMRSRPGYDPAAVARCWR